MRKHILHHAVRIAFLGASVIAGAAQAVDEIEPNQPIASAQPLVITGGTADNPGKVTVHGVLGNLMGPPVGDVDYYSFDALQEDVITVDIDCGFKESTSTNSCSTRSVDTIVAIFGPAPVYTRLRQGFDASYPLDEDSDSHRDSLITNAKLPATGTYTIGVSSNPRRFSTTGGGLDPTYASSLNSFSSGDYRLIISRVTTAVMQINIDIKPGKGDSAAPINPKSKGKIPVALLSLGEFDAVMVKVDSLRFGPTGTEASPSSCGKDGEDVNGDGRLDLVCHFPNQLAAFSESDDEGMVKGMTNDGRRFEGRGSLKVMPATKPY